MERIVARKLPRDLQDGEMLRANPGGRGANGGGGGSVQENAAAFVYDAVEGFQRKDQTPDVAISLEDAYNRVQSRTEVLKDLLMQYEVSLTLTRWIARVFKLLSSSAHNGPTTRITALARLLEYVFTKGLADLSQNGPSKILALTGTYAKYQRGYRRQPKQCNARWRTRTSAAKTPGLATNPNQHCGALLTTEQLI